MKKSLLSIVPLLFFAVLASADQEKNDEQQSLTHQVQILNKSSDYRIYLSMPFANTDGAGSPYNTYDIVTDTSVLPLALKITNPRTIPNDPYENYTIYILSLMIYNIHDPETENPTPIFQYHSATDELPDECHLNVRKDQLMDMHPTISVTYEQKVTDAGKIEHIFDCTWTLSAPILEGTFKTT